jgi:hypothetical protein
MAAVIFCRLSPCRHSGSTTRAAATGSTEPEGLRQLSGVAHHSGDGTEMVCFREVAQTSTDHFRDVPKLLLCGVHFVNVNKMVTFCHHFAGDGKMVVCSAAHGVTPHFPIAGFFSASAFFIRPTAFSITLSSTSSVMKGFSQSGSAPRRR